MIGHSWGGATAIVLASGAGPQKPVPVISHLILEDPAHHFGSGDPEERAIPYTRDIGRPADELRAESAASSPGWTEADIEGKIDALHKVSRECKMRKEKQAASAELIISSHKDLSRKIMYASGLARSSKPPKCNTPALLCARQIMIKVKGLLISHQGFSIAIERVEYTSLVIMKSSIVRIKAKS